MGAHNIPRNQRRKVKAVPIEVHVEVERNGSVTGYIPMTDGTQLTANAKTDLFLEHILKELLRDNHGLPNTHLTLIRQHHR